MDGSAVVAGANRKTLSKDSFEAYAHRMTGTGRPGREHRRIADVPSLRALTHPTRIALLEAIGLAGTLTATQASAAIGESPTACAYHLRMLSRLGFIEEAGGGRGRERPWRLAQTGISFDEDDSDPVTAKAADALGAALTERFISRIRAFQRDRNRHRDEVRAVTGVTQSVVFATTEEFSELRTEITALLAGFAERIDPALRPPGSQPFEIVMFSHVLDVPAGQRAEGMDDGKPVPDP